MKIEWTEMEMNSNWIRVESEQRMSYANDINGEELMNISSEGLELLI